MKTYVLYHASCADGFGAAYAAWLTYGDKATYIAVNYGEPCPAMDDHSVIYIAATVIFLFAGSRLVAMAAS